MHACGNVWYWILFGLHTLYDCDGFTRILQLLNDSNSSSNALWLPIFIVFRQSMPKFSELNNGILIKSLSAINDPSTQNGRSSGVFKIAPFYTHFNFERKSAWVHCCQQRMPKVVRWFRIIIIIFSGSNSAIADFHPLESEMFAAVPARGSARTLVHILRPNPYYSIPCILCAEQYMIEYVQFCMCVCGWKGAACA